jgi:hypothetical protein
MSEFEVPEKPESHKERIVGLIIAVIAVVLAIVSAIAHQTHNEEIVAHVDAADQFAFYQAKKERSHQLKLTSDDIQLQFDRFSPAAQTQAKSLLAGYEEETRHLEADNQEIKKKGDELLDESGRLAVKARVLDLGEIALQIAVVLCSITILTEQSLFVRMGITIAAVGLVVALWAILFLH